MLTLPENPSSAPTDPRCSSNSRQTNKPSSTTRRLRRVGRCRARRGGGPERSGGRGAAGPEAISPGAPMLTLPENPSSAPTDPRCKFELPAENKPSSTTRRLRRVGRCCARRGSGPERSGGRGAAGPEAISPGAPMLTLPENPSSAPTDPRCNSNSRQKKSRVRQPGVCAGLDVAAQGAAAVRSAAEDEGPQAPKQSLRAHQCLPCPRTLRRHQRIGVVIRTPGRPYATRSLATRLRTAFERASGTTNRSSRNPRTRRRLRIESKYGALGSICNGHPAPKFGSASRTVGAPINGSLPRVDALLPRR